MIHFPVINFIASFQNFSDGLPIQPCGFFLPREKNGKTSWVRPELVPKISFCLGEKKCFIFGKNETLWEKTKHSGGKTKMKIWSKIFSRPNSGEMKTKS